MVESFDCPVCGVCSFDNAVALAEHLTQRNSFGCQGAFCFWFTQRQFIDGHKHPAVLKCVVDDCEFLVTRHKGYMKEFHEHLKTHGHALVNVYLRIKKGKK